MLELRAGAEAGIGEHGARGVVPGGQPADVAVGERKPGDRVVGAQLGELRRRRERAAGRAPDGQGDRGRARSGRLRVDHNDSFELFGDYQMIVSYHLLAV
jgi:hypothetical protein